MPRVHRVAEIAGLAVAVAGETAVLYALETRVLRLVAGLVLLVPIAYLVARLTALRLGSVEGVAPRHRFQTRRFIRLRSLVERFLEEVRRLHRVAVDADRGFRARASAEEEMDRIEARLAGMVREIRAAAGVESAEQAPTPER
jgi:hypothetical protein